MFMYVKKTSEDQNLKSSERILSESMRKKRSDRNEMQ